jgi:hypothetical protein
VVCEFLPEQGVVVVQCGDRGDGGVKASMEIRAFAFFVVSLSRSSWISSSRRAASGSAVLR